MRRLKSDDIWKDWFTAAESARKPLEAPRPARVNGGLPVGMAALAALVIIVAVAGSRFISPTSTGATASTSPATASAQSSPIASPSVASPASAKPSSSAPPPSTGVFTTSGLTSNWQGFAWSQLRSDNPLVTADPGVQVLAWRGGYVAYGTTNGASSAVVWTSADGETWTRITAISAPQVLVAASPAGLVAISRDFSQATPVQTVWTSSDGVQWQNAGSPTGLAFIDFLAGTSTGLDAVEHVFPGSDKSATPQYGVVYSTDGLNWTPVTVEAGLAWNPDHIPQVQSGDDRFFLMVGAKDPANASGKGVIGVVWWSDDGRKWTRSSGTISYPGRMLDFGRDGILLHTRDAAIPGGDGLVLSTDGGKTWQADDTFGPLGVHVCEGVACSVGPDGLIASNGTVFLAVKSDGHAWVSFDGRTWTPIAWNGPAPDLGAFLVLPRGVVVGNAYGAAK